MMLNPLEVIQSYRPHDYSLTDLFDSRSIDPNKEFAVCIALFPILIFDLATKHRLNTYSIHVPIASDHDETRL